MLSGFRPWTRGTMLLGLGLGSALLLAFFLKSVPLEDRTVAKPYPFGTLSRTYIAAPLGEPIRFVPLDSTKGTAYSAHELTGHWSLVFFGFTSCPMVCPKTLKLLREIAKDSTSGVANGRTQLVFVTVDPEHDTQELLTRYLGHFDEHIIGLTGSKPALEKFRSELGAGAVQIGQGFDHSTSLFLVDPKGRLAGSLIHPSQASRVIDDLAELEQSYSR